jgi:signal transduction histidine kinase/DNA-binding response OmpR family regulator
MTSYNESDHGSGFILVLEDSPTQAQELAHVLDQHGYRFEVARNGQAGLDLLRSRKPVLIISDVIMPRMDGFEFCRRVKADPELNRIPVILLTSLSDKSDILRGLECGADNFVTKPYEEAYLLDRIRYFLVNRGLREHEAPSRGVEVEIAGQRHLITSERRQILDLLLSIYDQAVQINHKLKLREQELEASNARLSALHAVGSTASQSLNLSQILNDALDKLIEVVGLDIVAVLLVEDGRLVLKAYRNVPDEVAGSMCRGDDEENWLSLIGQVHEPVVVSSAHVSSGAIAANLCASVGRRLNCASFMCLPLRSKGVVQGLLLSGTSYDQKFSRSDIELMQGVSNQLAVAIENARLFEAERESRKQAEAANRAKDEFLAMVSHELRTPLSALLGWTRLLGGGKLNAQETANAIVAVERSARAQVQLVNDLLDVSRIVTGKLSLSVSPIDLSSVVSGAVEDLRATAASKGVDLEAAIDQSSVKFEGDPGRLRQVVANLISNAIKFTPEGGKIQVSLKWVSDPSATFARIQVTDSGAGISPEFLPHVFDRFRQADQSTTRQHGGLGLGLAIARHLVDLHGGTIQAASDGIGKGASFTIRLPQLPFAQAIGNPGDGDRLVQSADASISSISLKGIKVLVVDDHEEARTLFATVLNQYGAEVIKSASAGEAIRVLQEMRPDVLVSDIAMPGEDGFALIKKVRALAPESGGQTPAVAVTAMAMKNDRRILAAGYQKHLLKPIEPGELVATVASVVS